MDRIRTIEDITFWSIFALVFSKHAVAYHCEAEGQSCDRYYVHHVDKIEEQAKKALEAAEKNGADGVLLLKYPNTRRTLPDRSHD